MLPKRHRRLWRRRLRRRPLLPFLLLATGAMDAALIAWIGDSPLVTGFVSGQIALLAIWTTWAPTGIVLRAFVALAAVLGGLAATGSLAVGPAPAKGANIDLRGVTTAVVLASLAGNTAAAAAVHAIARRRSDGLRSRRKRFGVAALLWATSLVAVALGFGREATWSSLAIAVVLALVLVEALLTAAVLVMHFTKRSKALKLFLLVWLPVGLALGGYWVSAPHFFVYYAAQVAMVGGWLVALEPTQPSPTGVGVAVPVDDPGPIDIRV